MSELTIGLRVARAELGLSLSEAARLAGITKAHLHDMEAGRSGNPRLSTLAGLARAYNIPIGWLAQEAAKSLTDAALSQEGEEGNSPSSANSAGALACERSPGARKSEGGAVIIEDIGRYIDGTLQDDVHPQEVEFERVPGSGRDVPEGWACDFDVLYQGQRVRVTVSVTEAGAPNPPAEGGE